MMAAQCHAGAYLGRYVVVVDDDVDITNLNEVVWAMCTRSNPEGPSTSSAAPGADRWTLSSRATRRASTPAPSSTPPGPFEWKDEFPAVSQIDKETHDAVSGRWKDELERVVRGHRQ